MEFILRPWKASDINSLIKYANNWNIAKNLTNQFPHPYTIQDGKAFIEYATKDDPIHIFAIEVNQEAVGGIGIHPQSDIFIKNAELGYWLGEPFWGYGIVSKAIKQIIQFGFSTFDIERIFARPYGTNFASQKILEKNNFLLEGRYNNILYKNGEYLDELIYAIRRYNWENTN
ncbi:MAG: GNAT family N-acetyltransferase [Saprospiraceae bacterium]|jgi:ribosomal-protein-alanine N-acetyltransferase|nr:GNAT family N-acetyltransferase [Saprospiraceae bacterium]HMT77951.1 GNAT family N-acetyltransferase [Saprospiraceae bacterium]HQU96031.1 GNAT family N-acetyltransferase [Saprospiraceae bacterium]HQW95579.1 GNAT family N-acetyltransferase [Saprospiraceae bacterium]